MSRVRRKFGKFFDCGMGVKGTGFLPRRARRPRIGQKKRISRRSQGTGERKTVRASVRVTPERERSREGSDLCTDTEEAGLWVWFGVGESFAYRDSQKIGKKCVKHLLFDDKDKRTHANKTWVGDKLIQATRNDPVGCEKRFRESITAQ